MRGSSVNQSWTDTSGTKGGAGCPSGVVRIVTEENADRGEHRGSQQRRTRQRQPTEEKIVNPGAHHWISLGTSPERMKRQVLALQASLLPATVSHRASAIQLESNSQERILAYHPPQWRASQVFRLRLPTSVLNLLLRPPMFSKMSILQSLMTVLKPSTYITGCRPISLDPLGKRLRLKSRLSLQLSPSRTPRSFPLAVHNLIPIIDTDRSASLPNTSNPHAETVSLPRSRPAALYGSVLVCNITFEKQVALRFTLDDWQTASEVLRKHVNSLTHLPPPTGGKGVLNQQIH